MALPIERFKDAYSNWRYNPFTTADMAIDKEEDNFFIPGSSPFHIQLLEQPRKNDPTSVTVYCYDDVANFTEVATAPAQSQFRVDYPPADGEGTGQIEFNNLDAGKEVKVNYKATGSPDMAEFMDTKVSYPAGNPAEHQILGFVSGAPEWRYNPVCYFHERDVIYHASGENKSCLLFHFKRSAKQATVILHLKGAELHQGYYTELPSHTHGVGTLDAAAAPAHTHGVGSYSAVSGGAHTHAVGTLAVGNEAAHTHAVGTLVTIAVGNHSHGSGSLAGSQPTHTHGVSGNTANTSLAHTHTPGSYGTNQVASHSHDNVTSGGEDTGLSGLHTHNVTGGISGAWNIANLHQHSISFNSGAGGNQAVGIAGTTGNAGGHQHSISGATAAGSAHNHSLSGATASDGAHVHSISGTSAAGGAHDHVLSGNTASTGTTPKTYPDQLKVYVNSIDKTAEILALTALTQFGDGTGTHAFVTTGSGEMDISALIAAPGIHELKITAPISANGGRALLHLECY